MISLLNRLLRHRRGNVAMTFALAAIPICMMVGMGVDIANATRAKLALQDATDAAAVALTRKMATISDGGLGPTAISYVRANYQDPTTITVTHVSLDRDNIIATLDTQASVPTYFSQLLGVSSLPVSAHAVAKGMLLEISLVLDTSGSMSQVAGTQVKITALKTAAENFLDAMFGSQTTSSRVSVGIVPFATGVRVLPAGSAAPSWMDTGGLQGDPYGDFDSTSKTRFQLFSAMNQSWGGCVMTRLPPYDITDDTPTTGTPATLFAPWFAPDEPDTGTFFSSYENNYLSDKGGTCNGTITGWSDLQREKRTCKYNGATPAYGLGPNYLCLSNAVTPLTTSRSTLDTAINALQANGDTNILEGVMWGWRVLSPEAPFTQGKSYTSPNNRKVIVLMTDGMNNYNGTTNANLSYYFTYGFARNGILGQATSNNATLTSLLDAKTLQACSNAKAKGILIYTIGFGAGAAGSASLLQSCATNPSYYYAPQTSADLVPVFQKIAESINSLRIAH